MTSTINPTFISEPERITPEMHERLLEPSPFLEEVDLPIVGYEKEICESIAVNDATIIEAPTSSGKSITVPFMADKVVKALGLEGITVITQPRNEATRKGVESMAKIADCEVGEKIGYHVGGRQKEVDRNGKRTDILGVTERMLIIQYESDRLLKGIAAVVVDEIHEEGEDANYVLFALKQANINRKKLGMEPIRIVTTSATIDVKKHERYQSRDEGGLGQENKVGHIKVEALKRKHELKISYARREIKETEDPTFIAAKIALRLASELKHKDEEGNFLKDLLIFMPGQREVHKTLNHIQRLLGSNSNNYRLLPGYAELAQKEIDKIFEKHINPMFVAGTNIFRTSLTLDYLGGVIDWGKERRKQLDRNTGIEKLELLDDAQSDAEQKAGRAARRGQGSCIRLYTKKNFQQREKYGIPALQRVHLGPTILELKKLGVKDLRSVSLLSQPHQEHLEQDIGDMKILGALDENENFTREGILMAEIGEKPEVSRMFVEAHDRGCLKSVCIAAAFVDLHSPFLSSREKAELVEGQTEEDMKAELSKMARNSQFLTDGTSDFSTYINIWEAYEKNGFSEKWALRQGLNPTTLKKVSGKINSYAKALKRVKTEQMPMADTRKTADKTDEDSKQDFDEAVRKSIASGLIRDLMVRTNGNYYKRLFFEPPRGIPNRVSIAWYSKVKGSGLKLDDYLIGILDSEKDKQDKSKLNVIATMCQTIPRQWLADIAPHLCEIGVIEQISKDENGLPINIKTRARLIKGTNEVLEILSQNQEPLTEEEAEKIHRLAQEVASGRVRNKTTQQNQKVIKQANNLLNLAKRFFGL